MSLATAFATKVSADLIQKVAEGIFARYDGDSDIKGRLGELMPAVPDLVSGITRLLKEDTLNDGESIFGGATGIDDFTDALLGRVTNAVKEFQANAGGRLVETGLFDMSTIRRLLTRPGCGAIEGRKLDPGPPIEVLDNGRHVLRYFIKGLPSIGSAMASQLAFMVGVESWAKHLNLEISQETGDPSNANLIVTHEVLKADPSVLALTDVGLGGPNQGGQLNMAFDAAETSWTADKLQATTAHELGHALGIRHADVRQPGCLMNDTLDLAIKEPQPGDIAAARAKGWGTR